VASLWGDVAATSLPEGDDKCSICLDAFTEDNEDGSVRLVTQLRCRHTFCVLCLRQYSTDRNFKRQQLRCPYCKTEV
jgi:DNA-directed RNA polymerase subunit RPC12/RpoP